MPKLFFAWPRYLEVVFDLCSIVRSFSSFHVLVEIHLYAWNFDAHFLQSSNWLFLTCSRQFLFVNITAAIIWQATAGACNSDGVSRIARFDLSCVDVPLNTNQLINQLFLKFPCSIAKVSPCVSVSGNACNAHDRCVAAGYDNGDIKLFDLRNMSLRWETNVKNGVGVWSISLWNYQLVLIVSSVSFIQFCQQSMYFFSSTTPSFQLSPEQKRVFVQVLNFSSHVVPNYCSRERHNVNKRQFSHDARNQKRYHIIAAPVLSAPVTSAPVMTASGMTAPA